MIMKDSSEAIIESSPATPKMRAGPVACVDLDRFCEGCGYNLRTLPVYRDQRTGIPVVRCTECGRFQSANDAATVLRPWLNRATSVPLAAWMLTIVSGFIILAMAEGGITYSTLDELTSPGGYTTRRANIGTTTITWSGAFGPLQVRTDDPDYRLFITAMLAASFGAAFASILLAVVLFPHWRRVAYVGLALVMPIAAGGVVLVAWGHEAPHLFHWGLQYVMGHTGLQVLGGVVGIMLGRPFARLCVQVLLPPSVRPRLAYLWLADDKPPPRP